MALSGSYNFIINAKKILEAAARKAGFLATGQTLSGNDTVIFMDMLNIMVQAWQAEDIYLWTVEEETVNTVASTATLDLAANTLFVENVFIRISNNDHDVHLIDFEEYQRLIRKDNEGRPIRAAIDSQFATNKKLYFDPVPDQVYAVHYFRVRRLQDFDSSTNNADFPVMWTKALIAGLAAEIGEDKGLPIVEVREFERKAGIERKLVKRGNREDSAPELIDSAYPEVN